MNTIVLALFGAVFSRTAAVILGAIGLVLGIVHTYILFTTDSYPLDARGIWLFIVDHTWSLPNTVLASLFLLLNLIVQNKPDKAQSRHRTTVVLQDGLLPGFATTIGNVEAGTSRHISDHEYVHVLQARLLGPAYVPLVLANYVLATILPYWLFYHDHTGHPIRSLRDYFMRGVYPHVWNEEWAYSVQGTPP